MPVWLKWFAASCYEKGDTLTAHKDKKYKYPAILFAI
jgi:hypothetical protein